MNCKKSAGIALIAICALSAASAEVLTWRAFAGEQYETRLTQKETVTGLDSVTAKPTLVTTNALYQEEAAANKSTIPSLRNMPAFPRSSVEPGTVWKQDATVLFDLSGFGLDAPLSVTVPVSYTCVGMTEIDSLSFYHITAEWYPFHILDKTLAKRTGIARLSGVSRIDLLWDSRSGAPKRYDLSEEIQYRFTDGTSLLVTRDTGEEFKTVAEIVRERTLRELNEQIASAKVSNVEVTQSDEGIVLSIENIQFEANSAVLSAAEKAKLKGVGIVLSSIQDRKLSIVGHTASTGNDTAEELLALSTARAQSVADFLVEAGIRTADSVVASGMGNTKALAPNDTAEGRAKNRRVEIVIMDKEVAQ